MRCTAFLALVAVVLVPPALADATFTGRLFVGNPTAASNATPFTFSGVSESTFPCEENPVPLDGKWFRVTGLGYHRFTMTMEPTLDADTHFYTADCEFSSTGFGHRDGLGVTEEGVVVYDAEWVLVQGVLGSGTFTLVIR